MCCAVVVGALHRYQWQGLWTGMHAYATKELDSWAVSRRVDGKGAFQTNVTWDDGKKMLHWELVSLFFSSIEVVTRATIIIITVSNIGSMGMQTQLLAFPCEQVVAGPNSTVASDLSYVLMRMATQRYFTLESSTGWTTHKSSTRSQLSSKLEVGRWPVQHSTGTELSMMRENDN